MTLESAPSQIKLSLLKKLQHAFQKDASELIEIYCQDAQKKMLELQKSLDKQQWDNFASSLSELRYRSIDIGAVQFSHLCLNLEIIISEQRYPHLNVAFEHFLTQFERVYAELKIIQMRSERV